MQAFVAAGEANDIVLDIDKRDCGRLRAISTKTPTRKPAVTHRRTIKRRSGDKEFVKRLFHKKEVRYAAEP